MLQRRRPLLAVRAAAMLVLSVFLLMPFQGERAAALLEDQPEIQAPPPFDDYLPPLELMAKVLAAVVYTEIGDEANMKAVSVFHWNEFLRSDDDNPVLLCFSDGRRGFLDVLAEFPAAGQIFPIFANASLTCSVVHDYATRIVDRVFNMTRLRYALPMPSVLKVPRTLVPRVDGGGFVNYSATPRIAADLRIFLPPVTEAQGPKGVAKVLLRLARGLTSGAYVQQVKQDFIWAVDDPNLQEPLVTPGVDNGTGSTDPQTHDPVTERERPQTWRRLLEPVLNGSVVCSFDEILFTVNPPYLRLGRTATLHPDPGALESCILTVIAYFLTDHDVLYLNEYLPVSVQNQVASYITQSGDVPKWQYPFYDVGLNGAGQIVQVADTGVDQESCFFQDPGGPVNTTYSSEAAFDLSKRKVVQYVVWADSVDQEPAGHGTYVAGTVAGKAPSLALNMSSYRGVAPEAKIAVFDMGDTLTGRLITPSNLAMRMFPPAYKAGARIFSNSWATFLPFYTSYDAEIDKFMYDQPEALILVSAGNGGQLGSHTVLSPATSKNGMGIGASENEREPGFFRGNVAFFSSQGPTTDGRIKPDVVAPGQVLFSADSGQACGFTATEGTSVATPVMAASAALVRQYLQEGWYPLGAKGSGPGITPSGALVKAMLINSAVPMEAYRLANGSTIPLGLPPDNIQGHGRIKLAEVLKIEGSNITTRNLWLRDQLLVAEGGQQVFKFSIPDSLASGPPKPFKVTMVWTDPYVSAISGSPVLHDLDMTVHSVRERRVYYPNGRTSPDPVNTVEKVVLYSPQPGDVLTVTIRGTAVGTTPRQAFALVVSGDFVTGTWYCQNPSATRLNDWNTTQNCRVACSVYPKNPVCCPADAGLACNPQEQQAARDAGLTCDGITKPAECIAAVTSAPSSAAEATAAAAAAAVASAPVAAIDGIAKAPPKPRNASGRKILKKRDLSAKGREKRKKDEATQ